TVSPASVAEDGAANLIYTFTRSAASATPLSINFSVSGTATFGIDYTQSGASTYTATNGSVTIAAGATTATVTIDPTADADAEPDETVILAITSATGYTPGAPATARGTISNDD